MTELIHNSESHNEYTLKIQKNPMFLHKRESIRFDLHFSIHLERGCQQPVYHFFYASNIYHKGHCQYKNCMLKSSHSISIVNLFSNKNFAFNFCLWFFNITLKSNSSEVWGNLLHMPARCFSADYTGTAWEMVC